MTVYTTDEEAVRARCDRPIGLEQFEMKGARSLALLLLAGLLIQPLAARAADNAQKRREWGEPCREGIDTSHPKYFVKVYERAEGKRRKGSPAGNRRIPIFEYTAGEADAARPGLVFEAIDAEVDRNSRIIIEFDRKWIFERRDCFDAEILITASVKGGDEDRNIEVPGYSLVGKEAKVASVPIRSTRELTWILGEFTTTLNGIFKKEEALSSMGQTVQLILDEQKQLTIPLRKLADEKNYLLVKELGKAVGRDPDVLAQIAADVLQQMVDLAALGEVKECAELSKEMTNVEKQAIRKCREIAKTAERIATNFVEDLLTLNDFSKKIGGKSLFGLGEAEEESGSKVGAEETGAERQGIFFEDKAEEITWSFIDYLKDTSISVPLNADVGDRIVLRIQNGPNSPELYRELTVGVRVAAFGMVREVSDSFFFIKRIGVSSSDLDSAIAGVGMEADAMTATEVPREVNFEPAPGVTLAWTFRPRREKGQLRRWLTPGFGLNVSFPRFGSNVVSFTPADPAMPGSAATAQLSESASDIEVSAGVAVTLFDGALQLTYGANLNAPQDREYFGVGFSFLRVAQKIKGDQKSAE